MKLNSLMILGLTLFSVSSFAVTDTEVIKAKFCTLQSDGVSYEILLKANNTLKILAPNTDGQDPAEDSAYGTAYSVSQPGVQKTVIKTGYWTIGATSKDLYVQVPGVKVSRGEKYTRANFNLQKKTCTFDF